jgi:hypothetical protein
MKRINEVRRFMRPPVPPSRSSFPPPYLGPVAGQQQVPHGGGRLHLAGADQVHQLPVLRVIEESEVQKRAIEHRVEGYAIESRVFMLFKKFEAESSCAIMTFRFKKSTK